MAAKTRTAPRAVRWPSALRLAGPLAVLCLLLLPGLVLAEVAADAPVAFHDGHSSGTWTDAVALAAVNTPLPASTPLALSISTTAAVPGSSSLGTVAAAVELNQFPAPGLARPAWAGAPSTSPISTARRPWQSARLVEIPRDTAPGQLQQGYVRPRYALGFQSQGLKSLLASAGMDPHSCLAPIVRLRTKVSNGGDVSGTFWLYARCSFR